MAIGFMVYRGFHFRAFDLSGILQSGFWFIRDLVIGLLTYRGFVIGLMVIGLLAIGLMSCSPFSSYILLIFIFIFVLYYVYWPWCRIKVYIGYIFDFVSQICTHDYEFTEFWDKRFSILYSIQTWAWSIAATTLARYGDRTRSSSANPPITFSYEVWIHHLYVHSPSVCSFTYCMFGAHNMFASVWNNLVSIIQIRHWYYVCHQWSRLNLSTRASSLDDLHPSSMQCFIQTA